MINTHYNWTDNAKMGVKKLFLEHIENNNIFKVVKSITPSKKYIKDKIIDVMSEKFNKNYGEYLISDMDKLGLWKELDTILAKKASKIFNDWKEKKSGQYQSPKNENDVIFHTALEYIFLNAKLNLTGGEVCNNILPELKQKNIDYKASYLNKIMHKKNIWKQVFEKCIEIWNYDELDHEKYLTSYSWNKNSKDFVYNEAILSFMTINNETEDDNLNTSKKNIAIKITEKSNFLFNQNSVITENVLYEDMNILGLWKKIDERIKKDFFYKYTFWKENRSSIPETKKDKIIDFILESISDNYKIDVKYTELAKIVHSKIHKNLFTGDMSTFYDYLEEEEIWKNVKNIHNEILNIKLTKQQTEIISEKETTNKSSPKKRKITIENSNNANSFQQQKRLKRPEQQLQNIYKPGQIFNLETEKNKQNLITEPKDNSSKITSNNITNISEQYNLELEKFNQEFKLDDFQLVDFQDFEMKNNIIQYPESKVESNIFQNPFSENWENFHNKPQNDSFFDIQDF